LHRPPCGKAEVTNLIKRRNCHMIAPKGVSSPPPITSVGGKVKVQPRGTMEERPSILTRKREKKKNLAQGSSRFSSSPLKLRESTKKKRKKGWMTSPTEGKRGLPLQIREEKERGRGSDSSKKGRSASYHRPRKNLDLKGGSEKSYGFQRRKKKVSVVMDARKAEKKRNSITPSDSDFPKPKTASPRSRKQYRQKRRFFADTHPFISEEVRVTTRGNVVSPHVAKKKQILARIADSIF